MDAARLARAAEFERFYVKREKAREKRGELSPDQIGVFEAREIAALNRKAGIWK